MPPGLDHAEWYAQDVSYQRGVVLALAEAMGLELPPYVPPTTEPSARQSIFALLEHELEEAIPEMVTDDFHAYRIGLTRRLATYARNIERDGAAFEAAEREELGELLGARPATLAEGHADLEALVVQSESLSDAHAERLVRHFHRHAIREERLMRGALGAGEHAAPQSIA